MEFIRKNMIEAIYEEERNTRMLDFENTIRQRLEVLEAMV